MPGGAPEHHAIECLKRFLTGHYRRQATIQHNHRIREIRLQARGVVIAKRRDVAIILGRQPFEHGIACMHDKNPATRVVNRTDEIARETVASVVIQAKAVLDRHRNAHGVLHGLDAIGDQAGFCHQARTEGASLDALGRTAAVQVDLVVPPALAELCPIGQIIGVAAAQLQCHRMLRLIEIQMARQIAVAQRPGRDHLGVDAGTWGDQPVQVPCVTVCHVDHRRNAKPPIGVQNVSSPRQMSDRVCVCTGLGIFRLHIGKASTGGGKSHFICRRPMSRCA